MFLTSLSFIFNSRYRENIIIPTNVLAGQIKTNEEKLIESILESCFFKSFMACVLGWFLTLEYNLWNVFMQRYDKSKYIDPVF